MSFDLVAAGSYGSGKLGDVTDPNKSVINAYAAADDFNSYDFRAIPCRNSDFVAWKSSECVGCQVLLHALACKSGATSHSLCGRYLIATITDAVLEGDYSLRVTIDKSTADFTAGKNSYFWQAVLIPEFKNLTLHAQSVKPLEAAFADISNPNEEPLNVPLGGILVFKCSDTLTLNGGHVDLKDKGFDYDISTSYRPNANHESNGTLDADLYAGSENSIAQNKLIVNVGDGACLIMAKQITVTNGSSRIGNPSTYGVQFCRGASDSADTPAGVTNLGGSTIAVVTHAINNFTPNLIAKYHSGDPGRGLARAYLAVLNARNLIKPDEGLYALDVIKRDNRLKSLCNISGFGNAQDGVHNYGSSKPTKCWNSYAAVTAISGRVFTIKRFTAEVEEVTNFSVGRLVMIHQSLKDSANDWQDGRFFMSRITAVSGSTVTIKHNFNFDLSTYYVQMIVVPEFQSLGLGSEYKNAVPVQYSGGVRAGGICAVAVSNTCDLSGGTINMMGMGTMRKVVNKIHGNYQMKNALPIGQGHGSVFILARNLSLSTSTRLGATYDGSQFGGDAVCAYNRDTQITTRTPQGGWKGQDGYCVNFPEYGGSGGSGSAAGSCTFNSDLNGGHFSSAESTDTDFGTFGCQGAHIFIVADSVSGLNLSALSTGGQGGKNLSAAQSALLTQFSGGNGGCGYGGGGHSYNVGTSNYNVYRFGGAGGFRSGGASGSPPASSEVPYAGGGGSGSCFCYANNVVNQVTTGLVLS